MTTLLLLCQLAGTGPNPPPGAGPQQLLQAPLFRAPVAALAPLPDTGAVWVYFTDKGITTAADLAAAARATELSALPETRARRARESTGGFDFDDLPVREEYVQAIEELGARRRTVSRWLNAASFELPRELLPGLHRLAFVYDVRPVVRDRRPAAIETFPLPPERTPEGPGRKGRRQDRRPGNPVPGFAPAGRQASAASSRPDPEAGVSALAADSATAHRFYGPSFDQARMMGIPDLFYDGWFGSGVRLAIFDTGLRLDNVAVRDLRIHAQYDFLSGDNLFSAGAGDNWLPRPSERLRFLGLARDPAVAVTDDGALVAFAADSFNYAFGSPRRAIFSSTCPSPGDTWTAPQLVALAAPASQVSFNTFENLRLAHAGFASYLAYGEIRYSAGTGLTGSIWLNFRRNGNWQGATRLGTGRWPALLTADNRLFAAWVEEDTLLSFRAGTIDENLPAPTWHTQVRLRAPEPLRGIELAVADSSVLLVSSARRDGRLYALRSTDLGQNWTPARELAPAAPTGFRLATFGSAVALFHKDISHAPFTRLALLSSTDLGANWTRGPDLTVNTLSVGDLAAAWSARGLEAIYESAGVLFRTSSSDSGLTWAGAEAVDSSGFCYQPALAAPAGSPGAGGNHRKHGAAGPLAVWFRRGDDNAVWEPADTARFSRSQPDHGTRMASIIAGYSPYGIVGVAPGVELLVARTEFYLTAGGRDYEFDLEEDTYLQALEWAESRGADIVSTSLGYRGWYTDAQMDGRTAPVSVAASLAARRGMVVVTAMGNRNLNTYPFDRPFIVAPADAEGVVSAGGVQRDGSFWNNPGGSRPTGTGTGPTADGRCKPELVALSDTVAVAKPDSVGGLEGSAGTSCATALIAGAFALLREAHPTWPAESLKAVMYRTATRATQSCTFGFGIPRVDEAFRRYPPEGRPLPQSRVEAFPNPFLPGQHDRVWFRLELARPASLSEIRLYSASGALVNTLDLEPRALGRPGRYAERDELERVGAYWDGTNSSGRPVAAGLYLVVLHTTIGQAVNRFAIVR